LLSGLARDRERSGGGESDEAIAKQRGRKQRGDSEAKGEKAERQWSLESHQVRWCLLPVPLGWCNRSQG
jgi:hypothetical protein